MRPHAANKALVQCLQVRCVEAAAVARLEEAERRRAAEKAARIKQARAAHAAAQAAAQAAAIDRITHAYVQGAPVPMCNRTRTLQGVHVFCAQACATLWSTFVKGFGLTICNIAAQKPCA